VAVVTDERNVSQPADWGIRFQELTTEAGQLYARSLRRYQELLERVARRELTPEEVQRQFREYLQEYGPTSTRALVELSVGLLAGLLHLEARYRDALLDDLVPPADPPPPPPSPSSIDLANWFQALASYAAQQSARSMARQQQLVDRVATGEISSERVREQGRRFLDLHAPAFLGDVMTLGLAFVGGLQRSSAALADGLYDRVLGTEGVEPVVEPPICLDLHARTGEAASACIVVENSRLDAADVQCRVSDFARRSGDNRFRADVQISPERFRLAPGEQRDVSITVTIDPIHFAVGVDHVATMLISGAGERDLVVQLIARADVGAVTPVTPPGEAN
jgi:hypothetical protein